MKDKKIIFEVEEDDPSAELIEDDEIDEDELFAALMKSSGNNKDDEFSGLDIQGCYDLICDHIRASYGDTFFSANKDLGMELVYLENPEEHSFEFSYDSAPSDIEEFIVQLLEHKWNDSYFKDYSNYRIRSSDWHLLFGKDYRYYELNEGAGFDKCSFVLNVRKVNIDRFCDAYDRNLKVAETNRSLVITPAGAGQRYLDLPGLSDIPDSQATKAWNGRRIPFSRRIFKIKIKLSDEINVLFQVNNLPGKSDIHLLNTRVKPPKGHESLGNIQQYSFEQQQLVVREAMKMLADQYGIEVAPTAKMNTVELTRTFELDVDSFDDLMRVIDYSRMYADPRYTSSVYSYSGTKEVKLGDRESVFRANHITELMIASKTVIAKVYDKGFETMVSSKKFEDPILMEHARGKGPILVRVEYEIRHEKSMMTYFDDVTNGTLDLFDLKSQICVDRVYHRLSHVFFITPWEKYCCDRKKQLCDVFEGIVAKRGGKWKEELLKALNGYQLELNCSSPFVWEAVDLDYIIKNNPTFKKHPSRYKKELMELLSKSDYFPVDNDRLYNVLLNFFMRIVGAIKSKKSRVGYIMNSTYDKYSDLVNEYINECESDGTFYYWKRCWLSQLLQPDLDDDVLSDMLSGLREYDFNNEAIVGFFLGLYTF